MNINISLIEKIVSITAITNKWMMWCEGNTPDKSVFVPSVFQMRDAYSHLIQLLGKGFENGFLKDEEYNFNLLFEHEYSIKQLEEAFTHSTRAFYDCADYILLVIKQDLDEEEKKHGLNYVDLRSKLLKNDSYITELRSSKSEDMDGNYENIKKWDLFLQLITSSYVFADIDIQLMSRIEQIKTKINVIESKFSAEIIKNHDPKFYENKKIILDLEKRPAELEKYFENDGMVSEELLENPQVWCNNIVNQLKEKIENAEKYSASLDALQRIMQNSNTIQKRNGLFNICWGFMSSAISWVIISLLSSRMLVKQVVSEDGQIKTSTVDKLNLQFLIPFVLGSVIIFVLGLGIAKLISKKHRD